MGRTDCTEPQCLYKGALYLLILHIELIRSVIQRSYYRNSRNEKKNKIKYLFELY